MVIDIVIILSELVQYLLGALSKSEDNWGYILIKNHLLIIVLSCIPSLVVVASSSKVIDQNILLPAAKADFRLLPRSIKVCITIKSF